MSQFPIRLRIRRSPRLYDSGHSSMTSHCVLDWAIHNPLGRERVIRISCLWKLPRPGCSAFWGKSSFFWVWLSPVPPSHSSSLPCRQALGRSRNCFSNNTLQALYPAFCCGDLCPKICLAKQTVRVPQRPLNPSAYVQVALETSSDHLSLSGI